MVKVTQDYLVANSLAALNPKLAKEWHPTKNCSLTPYDMKPHSGKKAWWICINGHEWEAVIGNRTKGAGCPYCSGRKATRGNCLSAVNPSLSKEWHPTKNGNLTPFDITRSSNKRVWWKCHKGHEWQAAVSQRNRGTGCPLCKTQTSELELRLYAELKYLFGYVEHRYKNLGKELDVFIPQLRVGIEVDGAYWHRNREKEDIDKSRYFKARGIDVVRIRQKPLAKICDTDIVIDIRCDYFEVLRMLLQLLVNNVALDSDKKQLIHTYLDNGGFANNDEFIHLTTMLPSPLPGQSLADVSPALAGEWDVDRNGELTPKDVSSSSGKKVWWKCQDGHEWQATVNDRQTGYGCPYCANSRVSNANCLATTHPRLASEWHPVKNGDLTPYDVTYGSGKKVWWKCKRGHEWDATVNWRSSGDGCPFCANQRVDSSNSLMALNPALARQWHPTKNGQLSPTDIAGGSHRKVWWVCDKGHEWQSVVRSRTTMGTGCPYCAGRSVCNDNCLATVNPSIAVQWHPTKNGTLTPYDVTTGSVKKVWWICKRGHEWEARILGRSWGTGCPYCAGKSVCNDNCLQTVNPALAKQWHPTKNRTLTPHDVTTGAGKKVWWLCENGHEWQAVINDRNQGKGCPYCSGRKSAS